MPDSVFKIVELVGTSDESVSKAIEAAVAKAGSTIRQLGWFEVTEIRGKIQGGEVGSYQVTVKTGFKLED